jgi:hypothetical protein
VLLSTVNPSSFEELSTHVRLIAELVVAEPERLDGAVSGEYVTTVVIRDNRTPLVPELYTAPISRVEVLVLSSERVEKVVVASSVGVVPDSKYPPASVLVALLNR